MDFPPPPSQTEFEVHRDRAREIGERHLAASIAADSERDRRMTAGDASSSRSGLIATVVRRTRSVLRAIRP